MDNILILSHHKKKALKRCLFQAHLKYNRRKQKPKSDINLIFGSAFHNVLEVYYRRKRDISFEDLLKVFNLNMNTQTNNSFLKQDIEAWKKIGSVIISRYYDITKDKERFNVVEVEVPFFLSIDDQARILSNSSMGSRIEDNSYFVLAGKIDLIAEVEGDIYFIDHKTTSQTQSKFKEQFLIDEQLLDYSIFGNWLYGDKFKGVMVNGINKKIDNIDPPLFRDWYIYSEDEIYNALVAYLDTAQEYYILSQAPHLMQQRTVDFDCNRCEFLDVSLAKRKGEDWEKVLDLYYEDMEKFDWEM